jgi:hypothetical protein
MWNGSLLSALTSWAAPDGPREFEGHTLVGLIAWIRAWLEEPAHTRRLAACLEQMGERMARARRDIEEDLRAHPYLDGDLARPMQGMIEAYLSLEEAVDFLVRALDHQAGEEVRRGLEWLKAAADDLAMHRDALNDWRQEGLPRCPRCGSLGRQDLGTCPDCRLDLLIPDPELRPRQPGETALLGPAFVAAHEAYRAVAEGHRPLAVLGPALDGLQALLQHLRHQALLELREQDSGAVEGLVRHLEEALEGLERMRQVPATRRLADLHQGWERVFRSAVSCQQVLPSLLTELGRAEEAAEARARFGLRDSVQLQAQG